MRSVVRHLLALLVASALAACGAPADHWTEAALQPDGRTVRVQRTVYSNLGGGDLSQALTRYPNQYDIQASHPDTGEKVRWSGDRGWNPIMLGFAGSRTYLVLLAGLSSVDFKQYGCPEIPYVFLELEQGEWRVVRGADVPRTLLRANLSHRFDESRMKQNRHQGTDDIARTNASGEHDKAWFFSTIPTTFAEWPSRYKNQFRVRARPGCEHTVPSNADPSHPQWPGQPAQEVELEVLETQVYDPVRVLRGDPNGSGPSAWSKLAHDPERTAKCRALVKRVDDSSDRPELRDWVLFVKDPTGSRKARGFYPVFCDEHFLWFMDDDPSDRTRWFISKFTHEGVLVYRLKFVRPDRPRGFAGHFMDPTLRAEGGYIHGEWWNTDQSGHDRHIARAMKVRLREPDAGGGAKP